MQNHFLKTNSFSSLRDFISHFLIKQTSAKECSVYEPFTLSGFLYNFGKWLNNYG
jgi:hypothetical protein